MKTINHTFISFVIWLLFLFELAGSQTFTDISERAGVLGLQKFGAHGIMFADITKNSLPDLLVTNIQGREILPNLLFVNQGNYKFIEDGKKRGVWNINLIDNKDKGWFGRGTHGAVFADLDNDGDYDLVNATTDIRIFFYKNLGNGYFKDVTDSTGITSRFIATRGVTAFDVDGDGDLDIFGNNGWLPVEEGNTQKNEFYINEGDFKFRQVDQGLAGPFGGQGVADIDLDLDNDVDLLVARKDVLFENDGHGNFTQKPLGHGHRAGAGWMVGDFDNDGDFDLVCVEDIVFRKNYEILFFRRDNKGTYQLSQRVPADKGGAMGSFGDLDNDGDIDFYASGDNKIYLNDGRGTFSAKENCGMNAERDDPRGVSMADIDNDGDLDIMIACKRSFCIMYRNDLQSKNNWLKVSVTSPSGTAGGFGSIVCIYHPGKAGQIEHLLGMHAICGNQGYLGQPDPVLHFGLGKEDLVDIQVTFVGGSKITINNQKVNQTVVIKSNSSEKSMIDELSYKNLVNDDFTTGMISGVRSQSQGILDKNGWNIDSTNCQIKYDLGKFYTDGIVEFDVKGPLSQSSKRILFAAWNEESAEDGDRKTQGFFQIRVQNHGMMLRLTYRPGGRSFEGYTGKLQWEREKLYHIKGNWNTQNGTCNLWRDDQLLISGKFNAPFDGFRWCFIGKDNYKPKYLSIPDITFKNLVIYVKNP